MATATTDPFTSLGIDALILQPIVDAVQSCLTMCDAKAKCVGTSTVPVANPGRVTGMIGIHGNVSGFITVNMAEKVAMAAVGGLLQDQFTQLDAQVIDGVGEMTNIISGGIKNGMAGTPRQFSHVTVPSVIVGQNYQIAYAKGLEFLSVTFEHENAETFLLEDRLMKIAISMLRL